MVFVISWAKILFAEAMFEMSVIKVILAPPIFSMVELSPGDDGEPENRSSCVSPTQQYARTSIVWIGNIFGTLLICRGHLFDVTSVRCSPTLVFAIPYQWVSMGSESGSISKYKFRIDFCYNLFILK